MVWFVYLRINRSIYLLDDGLLCCTVGKERDHARGEGTDLQAGRHQGSHQRGAGRRQGVQKPDGSGTDQIFTQYQVELWMRSGRVVRASGCQCQSRNSPETVISNF